MRHDDPLLASLRVRPEHNCCIADTKAQIIWDAPEKKKETNTILNFKTRVVTHRDETNFGTTLVIVAGLAAFEARIKASRQYGSI